MPIPFERKNRQIFRRRRINVDVLLKKEARQKDEALCAVVHIYRQKRRSFTRETGTSGTVPFVAIDRLAKSPLTIEWLNRAFTKPAVNNFVASCQALGTAVLSQMSIIISMSMGIL
jgi:hypothetical protein